MNLATSAFLNFAALLLGAMGAMTAGYSGGLAFALEGMMTAGGLAGVLCSHQPAPAGLLAAGAAGAVYALLLWSAVQRKGDSLFAGIALNGLAAALTTVIARLIGGVSYSRKTFQLLVNGENVTVFLPAALLLFLLIWGLLFHSQWGLRLRFCGQSGETAVKMGLRVGGMRCLGFALCGFLAGIGGLAAFIALGGGWRTEWGVGGMGFLALAAVLLGRWRPWAILVSAVLFAAVRTGAEAAALAGLGVPEGVFRLLPFLLALTVLAIIGKKDRVPAEIDRMRTYRS